MRSSFVSRKLSKTWFLQPTRFMANSMRSFSLDLKEGWWINISWHLHIFAFTYAGGQSDTDHLTHMSGDWSIQILVLANTSTWWCEIVHSLVAVSLHSSTAISLHTLTAISLHILKAESLHSLIAISLHSLTAISLHSLTALF